MARKAMKAALLLAAAMFLLDFFTSRCPNCHHHYYNADRFCGWCGKKLTQGG